MSIQRLPQHVINKLKAGEIVERPMAVVKELVENSLDAGATSVLIDVEKGGKQLIKIQDNGSGISPEDLRLTVERYATSKISDIDDLEHISSYGFRGEALASISEVSTFRIQSKTKESPVGYELYRQGDRFEVKEIPFADEHGTIIIVEDLFHAIPVREKFLKTDNTEWNYIKQLFQQYALIHFDKQRELRKDGKTIHHLKPMSSLGERVLALTKKERSQNLKEIAYKDEQVDLFGLVGDASLHFPSQQYMSLFVNGRPVQDRLITKAIMQAFQRQIVPGTYPFACVFLEIDPTKVDVNVHPRKLEVKFLDPGSMFTRIKESIQDVLGTQKVNYAAFTKAPIQHAGMSSQEFSALKNVQSRQTPFPRQEQLSMPAVSELVGSGEKISEGFVRGGVEIDGDAVSIVGQLRDSYIVLQSETSIYYVDQHALAERITFEKMRKEIASSGFTPEVLLQPLTIVPPKDIDVDEFLPRIQQMGFDMSWFGEEKLVVYAVPQIFVEHMVDIELICNFLWTLFQDEDEVKTPYETFSLMLDEIVGMKACKASIKAGQKLSVPEMEQLMKDANTHIEGQFVCQHGRPSVVKVKKSEVDGLFDRH